MVVKLTCYIVLPKLNKIFQSLGLRVGMLVSALLMSCGTAIRCISMNETFFTWMAHAGANLNGIAGIVLCAVPPALSSQW